MPPPAAENEPVRLYEVTVFWADAERAPATCHQVIGWSLTDDAYVFSHANGELDIFRWSALTNILIMERS